MTVYAALADPVRRRIIERLSEGDRTAGELGAGFGISQPAVSKHLRVLREAGLVTARADAQRRVYRLNPGPLHEVKSWLAQQGMLWEERLDRLQQLVEGADAAGAARPESQPLHDYRRPPHLIGMLGVLRANVAGRRSPEGGLDVARIPASWN